MQKIQEKIEFYTFLYRIYWIFSMLLLLGVMGLVFIAYITKFRETVTVSQLFLLIWLMLFVLFLRLNALHYHRVVLELEHLPRRRPAPAKEEKKQPRPVRKQTRRAGHEK